MALNRVYCHTQHGIDRMSRGGVALANHRYGEDENRMRERGWNEIENGKRRDRNSVCAWRKSEKKRSENRSKHLPLFRIAFGVTSPFSL